MSREQELRQAIIDAPDDLEVRRIYADYLQHEGDVRGEYIALACNADHETVPHEMRRRALWQHHREAWMREDGFADDDDVTYRNGFCKSVHASPTKLLELTDPLMRQPIRDLAIGLGDQLDQRLDGVADHPVLPRVQSLSLFTQTTDAHAISDVINAARNITELSLATYSPPNTSWPALELCTHLDRVESIDIDGEVTVARAQQIARHLPRLKRLRLSECAFHDGALRVLAERLAPLDELVIGCDEFDDTDLDDLFAGPWTSALKTLAVAGAQVDARTLTRLAPTLIELELASRDRDIDPLSSCDWPLLETLDLSDTVLDELDLRRFPKLTSLTCNAKQHLRRIVESAPRLTHLSCEQADDADVDAIMTLPLDYLNLSTSQITVAAIDRIAQPSPHLRTLHFAANVGAPALARFATAPWPYIEQMTLLVGADHREIRDRFMAGWIERTRGAFYTYERKLELSGALVPVAAEPPPRSMFSRIRGLFK